MGVSYPLISMQRLKSVLLLQNETYLNRTSWGPDFAFGIDDVRFIQVGIIESSDIGICKVRFIQGSV
jgi:hypothetical protein